MRSAGVGCRAGALRKSGSEHFLDKRRDDAAPADHSKKCGSAGDKARVALGRRVARSSHCVCACVCGHGYECGVRVWVSNCLPPPPRKVAQSTFWRREHGGRRGKAMSVVARVAACICTRVALLGTLVLSCCHTGRQGLGTISRKSVPHTPHCGRRSFFSRPKT